MAASKVRGARESIKIIRNAGSVANFCNDVIGDIAGIISGSAVGAIIIKINQNLSFNSTILSIVLAGIVAAVTIMGKAFGKEIALRNSNYIVYQLGRLMSIIYINHNR